MADSSQYPLVVAVVSAGSVSREIRFSRRPTPKEVNLLYVLCEHVNRVIEMDDICHRLKATTNAVRILATRLRKKLSDDWTIDAMPNRGYRLLYFGGRLNDAASTTTVINKDALKVTRHDSELTRQRISGASSRGRASVRLERQRIAKV